jgi:hypothetical protein
MSNGEQKSATERQSSDQVQPRRTEMENTVIGTVGGGDDAGFDFIITVYRAIVTNDAPTTTTACGLMK